MIFEKRTMRRNKNGSGQIDMLWNGQDGFGAQVDWRKALKQIKMRATHR
jgi:hypothetical protein